MRVLATAKANKLYRWWRNLAGITLEARIINNKIVFYECSIGREHCLTEDIVKSLFCLDRHIKEQPFLMKENKDFYVVLNKHRARYVERYQQIKQTKNRKVCRTKF